jgi:hypothetical protein
MRLLLLVVVVAATALACPRSSKDDDDDSESNRTSVKPSTASLTGPYAFDVVTSFKSGVGSPDGGTDPNKTLVNIFDVPYCTGTQDTYRWAAVVLPTPGGVATAGVHTVQPNTSAQVFYVARTADGGYASLNATSGTITIDEVTAQRAVGSFSVQLLSTFGETLDAGPFSGEFDVGTGCF